MSVASSTWSRPGSKHRSALHRHSEREMGWRGVIKHPNCIPRPISPDGTVLLVEPMAAETIEDSVNPLARAFTAGSIFMCTPNAIATGDIALGNQVPEQTLREIVQAGGLSQFRRATETPFNRIFEARK